MPDPFPVGFRPSPSRRASVRLAATAGTPPALPPGRTRRARPHSGAAIAGKFGELPQGRGQRLRGADAEAAPAGAAEQAAQVEWSRSAAGRDPAATGRRGPAARGCRLGRERRSHRTPRRRSAGAVERCRAGRGSVEDGKAPLQRDPHRPAVGARGGPLTQLARGAGDLHGVRVWGADARQHLLQRRTPSDLVHPRDSDVAGDTQQPGTGGVLGADSGGTTVPSSSTLVTTAKVSTLSTMVGCPGTRPGREGRLEPGGATLALAGLDQGGLLAADVGARAQLDPDVEVEAGRPLMSLPRGRLLGSRAIAPRDSRADRRTRRAGR